ncbi:MAG: serine hydrolase domain-containing protein [Longimicrobiales bacterium]
MTRTLRALAALAFGSALLAPSPGLAQASAASRAPVPELRVDSVFADVDGPTTPGCALSVMRGGAPVYERGYGMANLEHGIPITPHSVFHVASVSKQFTAMAVELLVNEGKVSWDDDVRTYVPEVPEFGTPLTLRHLVHHVSGIRDQWNLLSMAGWRWEADVVTQGDVLDITSRQTAPNFPSGERYLYSNTGFTLLAVVVERVSGTSLREFAHERIFAPLGMVDTHFHDDHEMIVRNRAWAYAPDPDGLFGLKGSIPDFDVVGATSLFTTVHDLAAWDRNFITGRVGGPAALQRMQQRFVLNSGDSTTYGHGLTLGAHRGLRTVGHSGSDAGYRAQFLRFPDEDLSVAVLCNFPAANPGARALRVAEAYLEAVMEARPAVSVPQPVDVPASELAEVVGVYRGALPDQVYMVRLERDTLRLGVGGGQPVLPLGGRRFASGSSVFTYHAGRADVPAQLEIPGAGRARRVDSWAPSEADLREFQGVYASAELGTEYRLVTEEGGLVARHRKLDPAPLTPTFRDAFRLRGASAVFTRDASGRIEGFTLSDGRVWNVRFRREAGGA